MTEPRRGEAYTDLLNKIKSQKGGGVYINTPATFTKTSGTIYGGTASGGNANTAKTSDGDKGHAVFWDNGAGTKKVDGDLLPANNLSTTDPAAGWS